MAEAKINAFQFLSKAVVKQIALCSHVINSPSTFSVQMFSPVWKDPEEYSIILRLHFQSSSGFVLQLLHFQLWISSFLVGVLYWSTWPFWILPHHRDHLQLEELRTNMFYFWSSSKAYYKSCSWTSVRWPVSVTVFCSLWRTSVRMGGLKSSCCVHLNSLLLYIFLNVKGKVKWFGCIH